MAVIDLAIPASYVPSSIQVTDAHRTEHISVSEWRDPVNDRLMYRLQLHDLDCFVSLDRMALAPHTRDKAAILAHVKYALSKGATQLKARYFARWSSHDAEQLGVTWGLCHKCGQASMWQPVINRSGNPVWECRGECPR